MQWTPDRNAGFSTADPGKLYLPVVQSLVNHYAAVNVEAQIAQPTSLLHWVRGILDVRRRHPVFGNGDYRPLEVDNDAVLAFTRSNADETVLCVFNLANTARSTTVRLPRLAGAQLTDVFGGARFPQVAPDGSVTLTLGSRDFFWLLLSKPGAPAAPAPMTGLPAQVRPVEEPEPVSPLSPATADLAPAGAPAGVTSSGVPASGATQPRPETYVVPSTSAPHGSSAPRAPELPAPTATGQLPAPDQPAELPQGFTPPGVADGDLRVGEGGGAAGPASVNPAGPTAVSPAGPTAVNPAGPGPVPADGDALGPVPRRTDPTAQTPES
jgi:maltose alpha-D-glucosyltransferase/alpha-amylase